MNDTRQDLVDIIVLILLKYKKNKDGQIKEILQTALRRVEVFLPIDISEAANNMANQLNIPSLYNFTWSDQKGKSRMNDPKRSIFHWEHFKPIKQQISELVSLPEITQDAVAKVIFDNKICWILKEENRKLDRIAKSYRPNPNKAYEKASIRLMGIKTQNRYI